MEAALRLLPLAAVIFAFGGGYASHLHLASQLEALRVEWRRHEEAPGHTLAHTSITLLNSRVRALEEERRITRGELRAIREQQQQILRTLDALCGAMGKRCKRNHEP